MMKRNTKLFSILMITTLLLSGCSVFGVQTTPTSTPVPTVENSASVISQGNLVPKDSMYLSFPAAGHVSSILVKQGDMVSAGQVLASLGDRQQYQASMTAAQLEVENAQQALNDLNTNADISSPNAWLAMLGANQAVIQAETAWSGFDTDAYQKKIDDAAITVTNTQADLKDAQTEFDKYANLDASNPTREAADTALKNAQQKYDDAVHAHDLLTISRDQAKANLELAQAQQAHAQKDYDSTRQGPDPIKLTLAQMNLEAAQAHLAAAQSALDNLDIKAPFDGTVVDVNISVGQLVGAETWAVQIADFSEWYVETSDLTEQEVVKLSIGQDATITPDALPNLHLSSKVTEIADMFHVQAGDVLYKVSLRVDQPDPLFRWGMTVEITFNP